VVPLEDYVVVILHFTAFFYHLIQIPVEHTSWLPLHPTSAVPRPSLHPADLAKSHGSPAYVRSCGTVWWSSGGEGEDNERRRWRERWGGGAATGEVQRRSTTLVSFAAAICIVSRGTSGGSDMCGAWLGTRGLGRSMLN
jgi:hypothetical protein